jgi:hypothetical protein
MKQILDLEGINLQGTQARIVSPTRGLGKPRSLKRAFRKVEATIRERADQFYESSEDIREVGGYMLIRQDNKRYNVENLFGVVGEKGRSSVFPGKGLVFQWSCSLPKIACLDIDWTNVSHFVRYHSHPLSTTPNPQDITVGIEQLQDIPKDVAFYQTIYSKVWHPRFLWIEHSRNSS